MLAEIKECICFSPTAFIESELGRDRAVPVVTETQDY